MTGRTIQWISCHRRPVLITARTRSSFYSRHYATSLNGENLPVRERSSKLPLLVSLVSLSLGTLYVYQHRQSHKRRLLERQTTPLQPVLNSLIDCGMAGLSKTAHSQWKLQQQALRKKPGMFLVNRNDATNEEKPRCKDQVSEPWDEIMEHGLTQRFDNQQGVVTIGEDAVFCRGVTDDHTNNSDGVAPSVEPMTMWVKQTVNTMLNGSGQRKSSTPMMDQSPSTPIQISEQSSATPIQDTANPVFSTIIPAVKSAPTSSVYVGVADGVGSWNKHGINPALFSTGLMKSCYEMVLDGKWDSLAQLAQGAFKAMVKRYEAGDTSLAGSSTACLARITWNARNDKDKRVSNLASTNIMLDACNVGDSGVMLLRPFSAGESTGTLNTYKILYASTPGQMRWNAPFQYTIKPPDYKPDDQTRTRDPTGQAELYTSNLMSGDVVLIYSDGFSDNLYPNEICKILQEKGNHRNSTDLAQSLVIEAYKTSLSAEKSTPFGDGAYKEELKKNKQVDRKDFLGGKVDDISVIVLQVK